LYDGGYQPGVYCSFFNSFPTWLREQLANRPRRGHSLTKLLPEIWAFRPMSLGKSFTAPVPEDPPELGSPGASVWQLAGNANLSWTDHSDPARPKKMSLAPVDLSTSTYRDPSSGPSSNVSLPTKKPGFNMLQGIRRLPAKR